MTSIRRTARLLQVATLALGLASCSQKDQAKDRPAIHTPSPQDLALQRRDAERQQCRLLREKLLALPDLRAASLETLHRDRHRILGAARAWPSVFVQHPSRDDAVLSPYFQELARRFDEMPPSFSAFERIRTAASSNRPQARAVLMPRGYLFSDNPRIAQWLVTHLELPRLFDEPEIWLLRGARTHRLVRTQLLKDVPVYRFAEGPYEGQVATLLLFDRVATSPQQLFPAMHVDFVDAAERAGFDRMRIERVTEAGISAQVRYGADDLWIDSVFTVREILAEQACEIVGEDQLARVHAYRDRRATITAAAKRLRMAVDAQVEERLMFDEPKEEVGQQDGSLRPLWLWAYRTGATHYRFNDVSYRVFDHKGRAQIPQVCIDFVLDTFERASGTWYTGAKERTRTTGTIDFEPLGIPNRRSADNVVTYFREHPGIFAVHEVDPDKRMAFDRGLAFYDYVYEHADKLDLNHVVLIFGRRPNGVVRYHTLIVMRTDPVTGMPTELAENAGKPRVRSWQAAMRSAPRRSIRYILMPELSWLRQTLAPPGESGATDMGASDTASAAPSETPAFPAAPTVSAAPAEPAVPAIPKVPASGTASAPVNGV